MEIVTCRNPTTSDDGRLPLDFSSLFRGIRHFWSSLVVTFGRHFSPHIKNIFGKMFRTCRNYRPFVATSSRGRSGVVRRPEGEGVRSPRIVTCRHLSSLGRHLVVTWSSLGRHLVVTGRHFWSSLVVTFGRHAHIPNLLKSIKDRHRRCGAASPLRFSIAAAVQHRLPAAAAAELGRCGDGKGGMGV